jgi:hypothetical protein
VDDDVHPAQGIHAQRDEPLLILSIRVFDRHRQRIARRLLGVREADLVLAKVGLGFGWIELDLHGSIMHTLCI